MTTEVYRYTFKPNVPPEDLEASLLLAVLSAESLHGEAQVRLDAAHFCHQTPPPCVSASGRAVGRDLNRLFIGFLRREFGEDAFRVERLNHFPQQNPQEVQT